MKIPAILAATASVASAHTIFVQLESGGTTYPVSHGIRTPTYDGPITDVSSDSLACNGNPNPTMSSDKIIDVTAGSTVTAIWRHTLDSGPNDVMDASHKGPTLAYLKKVDSALSDSGIGDGWFKIQEQGYSNGGWATSEVITNGGKHAITIPSCLPDGEYLLRAEMIALHGAGSSQGAQLYVSLPYPSYPRYVPKKILTTLDGMRPNHNLGRLRLCIPLHRQPSRRVLRQRPRHPHQHLRHVPHRPICDPRSRSLQLLLLGWQRR